MLATPKTLREHLLAGSIVATVVGIALVALAEFGEAHQARIFGALLITGGGTGIGVHTGLADPRKLRAPDWLRKRRIALAVLASVLAVAPAVIALAAALAGAARETAGDRGMLVLGVAIGLLMLVVVLLTSALSVRTIVHAANETPEAMGETATPEDS